MGARHRSATPRKLPQQGRSRQTVDWILEAAARVFGERGYEATTTNLVAERAGVSVGSLYQYFPNKESLLAALAERHLSQAAVELTVLADRLRVEEPPLEVLVQRLVDAVVDLNRADAGLHHLLFVDAPRIDAVAQGLDALRIAMRAEVGAHLRRLGAGGAREGRADLRAAVVVSLVESVVHEVVLVPPDGWSGDDVTQELIAVCMRYLDDGGVVR